ncbi:MAG: hypothetical protein K2J33_03165 [Alistipes sp.]|nr:hypothetical protein [Alistipes sp.]
MKKVLFILLLSIGLVSCDGGKSSNATVSSSYSQPTTLIVNCFYCSGGGVVLNPYDGNYYYCQHCGGTGKVTVTTSGSSPSFRGGGKACTATLGCDCPGFDKVGAYGADQFECKHCHHNKKFHNKGRL